MATPDILEPLSTGDVIDRSIRIYRRNLRPLLATAAGPFLFGAASWLSMRVGLNGVSPGSRSPVSAAGAGALVLDGFLCYIAYLYVMVLVVAGLARVVGDYLLLGEPISVRRVVAVLRGRFVDLTVASLLLVGCAILIGMITFAALFAAVMIISVSIGLLSVAGLPSWLVGVVLILVILVALAFVVVIVSLLLSRVIFIPQIVMIEGASAGAAAGRAFTLGNKTWYRVLAVLLFTNCTAFSLAIAVMMPVSLLLWVTGYLSLDAETIESIYGGVTQFASFLLVPVWAIAFTLLYFDSRIRKEGYDVDLLVRRLAPPPMPVQPAPAWTPAPSVAQASNSGSCPRCGMYLLTAQARCTACGWYAP
jgi:hypothetical protein